MNPLNLRGYGDVTMAKNDAILMRDIIGRQGSRFAIDCISEEVGRSAVAFQFSALERERVIASLSDDFLNALSERL